MRGGGDKAIGLCQRAAALRKLATPLCASSQEIDQDRRVEKDGSHSAHTALIAASLVTNPRRRIFVPVVARIRNRPDRRFDQLPAPLVVECPLDRTRDERPASPRPDPFVELSDELVAQDDVHTHVRSLTH